MQPGTPTPSGNPSNSWKGSWIVLTLISIILPFYKNKLTSLLALKKEVDTIIDTAEVVLDVVEKLAEEVAEITDDLGDKLAEGAKLKDALNLVENVAREIVKDANLAEDLLEKAEKVEKEVESLICEVNKVTKEAGNGSIPVNKLEKVPKAKL